MLTSNCWVHHFAVHKQIDVEAKKLIRQMRQVAYRVHIGDGYYVSATDGYRCIDLRRFYVSYSLTSEHVRPPRCGLGLCLDEWADLVELMPTVHERHLYLAAAQPCYMQGYMSRTVAVV